MVALPFTHLRLISRKPPNTAYPKELKTIGDHIRKRRLDLGLRQKDLACRVNATTSTVTNWEKNRSSPQLKLLPQIREFLGYVPMKSNATTLGERIRLYRIRHGLSLRQLAKQLMIDPGTLAKWEKGGSEPRTSMRKRLCCVLGIGDSKTTKL